MSFLDEFKRVSRGAANLAREGVQQSKKNAGELQGKRQRLETVRQRRLLEQEASQFRREQGVERTAARKFEQRRQVIVRKRKKLAQPASVNQKVKKRISSVPRSRQRSDISIRLDNKPDIGNFDFGI